MDFEVLNEEQSKECREILYAEEMIADNLRYKDKLMTIIKRINKTLGED